MDLANTLIRSVVRAFYETRHILVVDALFIHSVYVCHMPNCHYNLVKRSYSETALTIK
jgi:hypothetical protein